MKNDDATLRVLGMSMDTCYYLSWIVKSWSRIMAEQIEETYLPPWGNSEGRLDAYER
jgi:hypothetical protein